MLRWPSAQRDERSSALIAAAGFRAQRNGHNRRRRRSRSARQEGSDSEVESSPLDLDLDRSLAKLEPSIQCNSYSLHTNNTLTGQSSRWTLWLWLWLWLCHTTLLPEWTLLRWPHRLLDTVMNEPSHDSAFDNDLHSRAHTFGAKPSLVLTHWGRLSERQRELWIARVLQTTLPIEQ